MASRHGDRRTLDRRPFIRVPTPCPRDGIVQCHWRINRCRRHEIRLVPAQYSHLSPHRRRSGGGRRLLSGRRHGALAGLRPVRRRLDHRLFRTATWLACGSSNRRSDACSIRSPTSFWCRSACWCSPITAPSAGFSLWAAVIILMREIFVSGLREFLADLKVSVPVTRLAKWKTTPAADRHRHPVARADRRQAGERHHRARHRHAMDGGARHALHGLRTTSAAAWSI